MTQVTQYVSVP